MPTTYNLTSGVTSSGIALNNSDVLNAFSGGVASATMVNRGGTLNVLSGGVADGSMVNSRGSLLVSSGGVTIGSVLALRGAEQVDPGGVASGTIVSGGAFYVSGIAIDTLVSDNYEYVYAGGLTIGSLVKGLGAVFLFSGGVANATVLEGGYEYVFSAGVASGTVVNSAGLLDVQSGGVGIGTLVSSGAQETVFSGGTAGGTVVSSGGFDLIYGYASGAIVIGGTQNIYAGGVTSVTVLQGIGGRQVVLPAALALGTIVDSNGLQTVTSGGLVSGTVVSNGGTEILLSGGVASDTTIEFGGFEVVSNGGMTISTTVSSGGTLTVSSGGIASGTTLRGDDPEFVYSGSTAVGTIVDAGSFEAIYSGGVARGTVIKRGGAAFVFSGGLASGTVADSGGLLVVLLGGSQTATTGTVISSGLLLYQSNTGFSQLGPVASNVVVSGGDIEYVLDGGLTTGTTVNSGGSEIVEAGGTANFTVVSRGGTIDLPYLPFNAGGSATLEPNGILRVTEGSGSYQQELSGPYSGEYFQLTQDSPGGTVLTLEASPRTLAWTGADNTAFATASNWNDVTNDLPTALSSPEQRDTVEFLGGGGAITGSGTVAALTFNSGDAWQVALGAALTAAGAMMVGASSATAVEIEEDSSVFAAGATIASDAGASGSSVNVSGPGSNWTMTGPLIIGSAGYGSLSVSQSATVIAGDLDAGAASGGDGVISVVGTGTALTLTGDLDVGDQSTGELSILSGAVVSAVNGNFGGTAGTGNVDIEGTGSALDLSGTLSVGLNAPAVFTLGQNTELTLSGSIVVGADGVFNQDGTVDPPNVVNDNVTNLGNGAKTEADVSIENSGLYTLSNGTASMYTPLITYDANPDTDGGSTNGVWQIGNLGTLVLNATTVDVSQTVEFTKNNAVLEIGQVPATNNGTITGTVTAGSASVLAGFEAPIQNYKSGDRILLEALSYGSDTVSGNTVTIWSGVAGTGTDLGSLSFMTPSGAADDTGAGLAAMQIETLACFVTGARIGTEAGPRSVETIAVGDYVLTADGRSEAVIWVGSRTVDCPRHPRPENVWPVRVSAGAVGKTLPVRDLYLSPDHAVFVNGVLVPVRLLVNGTTIARVRRQIVTYHHVELSGHEVILAEGLPVESYLDTGDRADFTDYGAARLFPDFETRRTPDSALLWETRGCAKLVQTGAELMVARGTVTDYAPSRRLPGSGLP
jgi:T5SS/PEP-CTERM-associated repeat protein/autotransporter passenger strand-loop-strand repeat protein